MDQQQPCNALWLTNKKRQSNQLMMRRALEVILPVSLLSLVVSYLCSCLPCYLHSIASLLRSLNQFTTKKAGAMLLFSNLLLLLLTVKGSGITTDNPSNFLASPFDDELLVVVKFGDKPSVSSDDRDSTEAEEERVEEKRVIEESIVMLSAEGNELELVLKGEAREKSSASYDSESDEMKAMAEGNELDLLDIYELNRRFDDFIGREKRKWRLEALQPAFA